MSACGRGRPTVLVVVLATACGAVTPDTPGPSITDSDDDAGESSDETVDTTEVRDTAPTVPAACERPLDAFPHVLPSRRDGLGDGRTRCFVSQACAEGSGAAWFVSTTSCLGGEAAWYDAEGALVAGRLVSDAGPCAGGTHFGPPLLPCGAGRPSAGCARAPVQIPASAPLEDELPPPRAVPDAATLADLEARDVCHARRVCVLADRTVTAVASAEPCAPNVLDLYDTDGSHVGTNLLPGGAAASFYGPLVLAVRDLDEADRATLDACLAGPWEPSPSCRPAWSP